MSYLAFQYLDVVIQHVCMLNKMLEAVFMVDSKKTSTSAGTESGRAYSLLWNIISVGILALVNITCSHFSLARFLVEHRMKFNIAIPLFPP